MKYKAAIFDMDGTILNTIDDIYDIANMFLRKYSYPEKSLDYIKAAMGGGANNLIRMLLPQEISDEKRSIFFNDYCPYYESHGQDKTKPYPGVIDLLKGLKACGVKIAVVSSKPQRAVEPLCLKYFGGIFDLAIGDDFNRRLKPYPDGIYDALKELNIDKKDAVYIGDSEYDVLAAQNAGVDGIAVSWGYRKRSALEALSPVYIADNISELRDIIFSEAEK